MTESKQEFDTLRKLEWLVRIQRKLSQRVDVLGAQDAIPLMRQIEALL